MEYDKPPLLFEEQAKKLISRGLLADHDELIERLSSVSYYRLSGYLYPFRKPDSDDFVEGITLRTVWNRYCFDRRLRVLLLDAIERIEVAIRARLVYEFTHAYGAFGHTNEDSLPKLKLDKYIEWRGNLLIETSRGKEAFIKHFKNKYGDSHRNLPLWMCAELMSMGSLLTLYKGVEDQLQRKVSAHFSMPDKQLENWLLSLYEARNICAHHARLWNRTLGCAPGLPHKNKHPDWHQKNTDGKPILANNRCGILLFICHHFLLMISPSSQWKQRIVNLFAEYPEIPVRDMGLPENWQEHSLWNR